MALNTFQMDQNTGLQAAYAEWANMLCLDANVAIDLGDSIHNLSAMLGILSTGRKCGIMDISKLGELEPLFTPLTQKAQPNDASKIVARDTHFITFTGGTTGTPKAVIRSQESWVYSFLRLGITKSDYVGVLGSLKHSLSLYGAMEALSLGAGFVDLSNMSAVKKADRINIEDVTVLYATPTQLRLLPRSCTCPNVNNVFIGGGSFGVQDRVYTQQIFPNAAIRVFYGLAETSFVTIANKDTPADSVGGAFKGVEISIDDERVLVRSPMMGLGYLNHEFEFEGPFFDTGEKGRLDAVGNLYLHGRSDRAVTVADKTMYLDKLEENLRTISGVQEAGVVALPDPLRGLRPFGAILGKNHIKQPPLAEFGGVFQISDWPLLSSGKTDYETLKSIIMGKLNGE